MKGKKRSFRVGRVRADLRGKVWYLTYHENGIRHRPRVGLHRETARQLAAQINSQLEVGAPSALSFEALTISELQDRWLSHHEQVLRSSVQTINRYRAATNHLLAFIRTARASDRTASFRVQHAEEFVRYLRTVQVTPNGHENARRRPLLDKGIKYILCCGRTMFNYAKKRRHLSPYAENPLIRCELMGHAIGTSRNSAHGLGMTANYTHTQPETKRRQLTAALERRPSFIRAIAWCRDRALGLQWGRG